MKEGKKLELTYESFEELLKGWFHKNPGESITWTQFRENYDVKQKAIPNQWVSALEEQGLERNRKKGKIHWTWDDS